MNSVFWLMAAAALAGPPPPQGTLVVSLGRDPAAVERVRAQEAELDQSATTIVTHAVAIGEWLGFTPAPPAEPLEQLIERARALDADFASQRAAEVYEQIGATFDRLLRPSAREREVAALALLELATVREAAGDREAAVQLAREAARRFPDHPPDRLRYPPRVLEIFDAAIERLQTAPTGRLVVTSPQAGEVLVDGRSLGVSRGRVVRSLPVGRYRVWLVTAAGSSLPHPVTIDEASEVSIAIDADFDRCVELEPLITLTCEGRWERDLATLVRLLAVDRGLGVPPADHPVAGSSSFVDGVMAITASELPPPEVGQPAASAAEEAIEVTPLPRFSPLFLIPLGGAQFAQDRPVFGGIYLAAGLGTILWTIIAAVDYDSVVRSGDVEAEPGARLHRNLAIGITVSLATATILEAVIYALVTGE